MEVVRFGIVGFLLAVLFIGGVSGRWSRLCISFNCRFRSLVCVLFYNPYYSSTMAVPETKELKAQWKGDIELPEYTMKDVAAHNTKTDMWIVIHGQGKSPLREH